MLPDKRRFTLSKRERLCSKNIFEHLFTKGSFLRVGAISVYYSLEAPGSLLAEPLQVAFSAPKRHFKAAVSRNYIKRRLREVFRTEKPALIQALNEREKHLVLLISYNSRKKPAFSDIHYMLNKALSQLLSQIES